jgi:drug/metabolite transporter (DMT)-like permease
VITASLPVVFSLFTQGAPALTRILGFGLALAGIALVSAATGGSGGATRFEMTLSVLAGIGFGSFFICFSLVDRGRIFTPLILSRGMTLLVGVLLLKINRLPIPSFTANPVALLAGVLDAGGNMFFILARQYASLDVVSVLASLYPVSTVILAGLILKEKITPLRWAGVALCLAAIALITV